MKSDRKLPRIAIVGAGFLAETRARCYASVRAPGVELTAVCARTLENARNYAARHAIAFATDDYDALLAREDIDAVDLCIPNRLHRSFCERAAEAGKHVICTKPMTAYVGQDLGEGATDEEISGVDRWKMARIAAEDAEAMHAACTRANRRFFYGENWVHAPALRRAAGLLAVSAGPILEMRGYEAHKGSHSPFSMRWRDAGGGALLRLGAHPIGAMLWLKRREGERRRGAPTRCVRVTCDTAVLTQNPAFDASASPIADAWVDVENWGCAILEFDDGSRGIAWGSDNQLGGMQSQVEINASRARFECSMSPNDALRAYTPTAEVFGDAYIQEKLDGGAGWSTPIPSEDVSSGQFAMIDDFVRAIAEDRDSESDGWLGVEVTRVIYAAYVAAAEGRRVALAEIYG